MKRYENFSPAIPDSKEENAYENNTYAQLPPAEKTIKDNHDNKTKKTKRNSKKEIKTNTSQSNFFKKTYEVVTGTTMKWIIGLLLAFFAVYLGIAFFSYFATCVVDQSEINNTAIGSAVVVANAAGEGGARLSEFLINEFFGIGSFVIIFWLFAVGLRMLSGRPR